MSKKAISQDPLKTMWNTSSPPTIEEYWSSEQPTESFPCFLILLYKTVSLGEEGDDDPSHILENVIHIYPSNIPNTLQQAIVGVLVSFMTFSRLNLDRNLTSFSLSHSEMAIKSKKLDTGNYLLYVLKMPNVVGQFSVNNILERTVNALNVFDPKMYVKEPNEAEIISLIKKITCENSYIFRDFTFRVVHTYTPSSGDTEKPKLLSVQNQCCEFNLTKNPIYNFKSKPQLIIATGLYYFISKISNKILGFMMFHNDEIIVSTMNHWNSSLLLVILKNNLNKPNKKIDDLNIMELFLNPKDFDIKKNEDQIHVTLIWKSSDNVTFLIVVDSNDGFGNILIEVQKLLNNGLSDFAKECKSENGLNKSKPKNILAIWKDSGIICEGSGCTRPILKQMNVVYEQIQGDEHIMEIILNNGENQIVGLNMMDHNILMGNEVGKDAKDKWMLDEFTNRVQAFKQNESQKNARPIIL